MYMETPKGQENGDELDVINLRTLRGLIAATKPAKSRKSNRPAVGRA
jgi:hypothetical protein